MRRSVEGAEGISSLALCLVSARAHLARTLTPALSHPMGEGEHRDCGSVHITRLWINLTRRYARPASLRVGVAPRSTSPPPSCYHARMDEQLGRLQFIRTVSGINAGLSAGATVALWSWAAQWASLHRFGLLNWLGLTLWPHALGAIASFDLWMYWWHRANHRVGLLWRFHRTHHSDPKMDVTTAHRFHFGEILFSSLLRVPVILLVGVRLWELVCYETLLFAVVQLHHANVALAPKLDRCLRVLIVTPTIHKVHHSRFQPETDSNYSSLFSLWDRLFHTLKLRPDPATIEFGLKEFDSKETQTFLGLLKTPWGRKVRREA